jgi:seryl-tRNA synthetase
LVVPTLCIACSLVVFAGRIYEEKLDALQSVREAVSSDASGACGQLGEKKTALQRDPRPPGRVSRQKDEASATQTTDGREFAKVLPNTPNADLTQGSHEHAGASNERAISTAGLLLPLLEVRTESAQTMVCNEQVRTGNKAAMRNVSTGTFDPTVH